MAPGNYVMQASKPGYYSSSGTVSVLAGSMVELTLKLQAVLITGDLRVTVKDSAGSGVSGASLSSTSQPGGQDAINGMSNADGVVVFKDILSGSYTLQA
ncbi:MAG: carboxypeptidase-like regulatory domain-containing protein [Candidatus Bathyarchaeota archaeon]|nr:carboxypeptidase-like regulatory domain-containing protein [Candidatus Bathyarchaeota archaeon]